MGLDEVPLSMCLLDFGMRTMLANFHMCDIMLVFRGKRLQQDLCFRCMMFNLSGPCEFLSLLCFIAYWN